MGEAEGFPGYSLGLRNPGQERREDCPTQTPCTHAELLPGPQGGGQIHRELQGTKILRGSKTTPHRQTVIIINIFSLNYMMSVECG